MIGFTERDYDRWLEKSYFDAYRESTAHEAYQESVRCLEDAVEWWHNHDDADILQAFIDSTAYADAFEDWREPDDVEPDFDYDDRDPF